MIDFSLLLLVGGAAIYGSTQGWRPMSLRLLAVVLGYVGAFLLARPLGGFLVGATDLPLVAALPIGGVLAFFVVSSAVTFAGRRVAENRSPPSSGARLGGAALGAVSGAALAVVLGWAAGALGSVTGALPDAREGPLVRTSAQVVRVVTATAGQRFSGDRFLAEATASLVSDPAGAMEAARTILDDDRLREALGREGVLEAIRAGDPGPLSESPAMTALARDEGFVEAALAIGLIQRGRRVDARTLARDITEQLGPGIRTMEALGNDAEFQRMLDESEVADAYAEGNLMAVLSHPEFTELAGRVVAELRRQQRR